MSNRSFFAIFITVMLLLASSCAERTATTAASSEFKPEPIGRLDLALASGNSDSLARFEGGMRAFAGVLGVDSSSLNTFATEYLSGSAVRVFGPDVTHRLPSLANAEKELGRARALWPSLQAADSFPRTVLAIISPYNQSVFTIDTILFIATNHFLGPDYEGYASFQDARRLSRQPGRIATEAVESLVRSAFDGPEENANLLQAMLYEGAVSYVTGYLTGVDNESYLLAIDPSVLKTFNEGQRLLWKAIVGNKMLFSTDQAMIGRVVSSYSLPPAALGIELPGAGRYLGFRLITEYMRRNPDTPPARLLGPEVWADPAMASLIAE